MSLRVNSGSDEIIFFGKIPAYMGDCKELTDKVFNFYISFTKGDLNVATSFYFELSNPLKEELLKVKDPKGLNLLQKLLIKQKKDAADNILAKLSCPSKKNGYEIVSENINNFYSNLKDNNLDKAYIVFKKNSLVFQKALLKVQDEKGLTFLHKLILRGKNDKALDIIKSIPKEDRKKIMEIKDKEDWTILNFARQNEDRKLSSDLKNLI
ncbi:MAG: hypothetical protein K940chlam1_00147 [Candidatus Anoxychlamydiales bacterium]|nr:hypothetical protein [Candidatus Anoxychlamydiales bacterium]NGX35628.1 hypothetical protein [Candidatus Anoxychlamydiales bacterium]